MNHSPKVAIVILNRNGRSDTVECLESVFRIDYPNYEVIVADNASMDGSLDKIKEWVAGEVEVTSKYFSKTKCTHVIEVFDIEEGDVGTKDLLNRKNNFEQITGRKKLYLLKNKTNFGFAKGNNIAAEILNSIGGYSYFCLLNNDTVVESNFLSRLVEFYMQKGDDVGSVSSLNVYYGSDKVRCGGGKISRISGTTSHLLAEKSIHDVKGFYSQCDYGVGSALLVDAKNVNKYGLFDDKYFMYCEDVDFGLKLNSKSLINYCLYSSVIYHKVSQSSKQIKNGTAYYEIRNRIWTMKKHLSGLRYLIFLFIFGMKVLYWIVKRPRIALTARHSFRDGIS